MNNEPRHFLDLIDIAPNELRGIIEDSRAMKAHARDSKVPPMAGKMLAMIFDKPSTRTRVSFDVAMRQLGGQTIVLTGQEMQLGRGETVADTARVLSRYVDAIMIRTLEHGMLLELAQYATVPVINGLTRRSHPCQIMADVMTFEEHVGPISGRKVAWTGDCQQRAHLVDARGAAIRLRARGGDAAGARAEAQGNGVGRRVGREIEIGHDPEAAVAGADAVVTDTWVSMGDKDGARRHNLLRPYQVNSALMAKAKSNAIFLHCLPAHRGDEVTDEVIDGPQSAVFDEAENRLHAQKGILAWCFNASPR